MPQASEALTVKVRIGAQAVPLSTWVTVTLTALQLSEVVTSALTLASVGSEAGLQPRLLPTGTVTLGAVVSAVQL